ncbi:MAG: cytochrome P450 [Pseudomonadales bacterium]
MKSSKLIAEEFELTNLPDDFHDNPYLYYQALREHLPVKRLSDGSVLLSRYRDLDQVYRQQAVFSSDKRAEFKPKFGDSSIYEHHTSSLVFNDPPGHTRVRHLMQGALSAKAVSHMSEGLISLVDRLLDDAETRGTIDLIDDFASAIPVEVIGNLLGIPLQDRGPLRDWSLSILGALEPSSSVEFLNEASRSVDEFVLFLRDLIAQRRKQLGNPEVDVLSRLIIGEGKRGGKTELSDTELYHNCIFLLNAGHETTTNLIGNGLMALLDWPEQLQKLLAAPELIDSAVEEFLRFESSNQLGNRRAMETCEVGGVALEAGTLITLCIGAANRDPDVFDNADSLDIARSPNRHLAFAVGPHFCLGANLARLEATIAIGRFLQRFPRYECAGGLERGKRVRFRGYLHAPVRLW